LAGEVHTIERLETLFRAADERLARLGYKNVQCYSDDGTLGLPQEAPFDVIICTAGAEALPAAYEEQLGAGGRLIIPIGPPSRQEMFRFTRRGDAFDREDLGSFGFVPLVGDMG
jgi:protein-L-isoaspartate(D-aspartate) O-methyltransferase